MTQTSLFRTHLLRKTSVPPCRTPFPNPTGPHGCRTECSRSCRRSTTCTNRYRCTPYFCVLQSRKKEHSNVGSDSYSYYSERTKQEWCAEIDACVHVRWPHSRSRTRHAMQCNAGNGYVCTPPLSPPNPTPTRSNPTHPCST